MKKRENSIETKMPLSSRTLSSSQGLTHTQKPHEGYVEGWRGQGRGEERPEGDANGKVMKHGYLYKNEKKTVEDEEKTQEKKQGKKAASLCCRCR